MASNEYRKLPGKTAGLLGSVSYWVGPDHLLVASSWITGLETYRRYYYHQIKALILAKTNATLVSGLILGVVGLMITLGGLQNFLEPSSDSKIAGTIFMSFGGVILLLALVNFLLGRQVQMYVLTEGGLDRLGSRMRARKARRVQEMLQPLIENAQSGLSSSRGMAAGAPQAASYVGGAQAY